MISITINGSDTNELKTKLEETLLAFGGSAPTTAAPKRGRAASKPTADEKLAQTVESSTIENAPVAEVAPVSEPEKPDVKPAEAPEWSKYTKEQLMQGVQRRLNDLANKGVPSEAQGAFCGKVYREISLEPGKIAEKSQEDIFRFIKAFDELVAKETFPTSAII